LNNGSTRGFSLVYFVKGEKIELPFKEEDLNIGDCLTVSFDSDKENQSAYKEICFSDKDIVVTKKYRMSQDYSLVYLKNSKDQIFEYIFYYDPKKHSLEEFSKAKNFKKMVYELKAASITPNFCDVSGNSVKNLIVKLNNNYSLMKN